MTSHHSASLPPLLSPAFSAPNFLRKKMVSPKLNSRKSLRTLRSMLVGQRQCLPLLWQNTFLARNEWLLVHDVKWKRVSNMQPNFLAPNVRRDGQEPSLFVRISLGTSGEFSPSDSRAWVEKQAENAPIG